MSAKFPRGGAGSFLAGSLIGIDLSKQDRISDSLLYCKSVQWHIIFSICQVSMYMFEIYYFHSVLNNSPNIVSLNFAMHC